MILWLNRRLRCLAWPSYACEDCIGMRDYGCYCMAADAEAPCTPVKPWREKLRRLLGEWGWRL